MSSQDASYIDYEVFLDPSFSAASFANSLVLSTNNASDSTLDLSTPLSKTLFDLQEVDTHIHNVTTQAALPLLTHTQTQNEAASRLLATLENQVTALTQNYARLESEVIGRHAAAEQIRLCAARLWVTLRIGRAVARALALGRRLDAQMTEVRPNLVPGAGARRGEEHRAMLAATHTLLALRSLFAADGPGMEGEHLGRIVAVGVLRRDLVEPSESRLKSKAQQIVREYALTTSSGAQPSAEQQSQRDTRSPSPSQAAAQTPAPTFTQTVETRSRTTAALTALYLLSPAPPSGKLGEFTPTLLLTALQTYLQTSLTSSTASLSRALAQLPQLSRALQEVTARCRNVVGLENLLRAAEAPSHPLVPTHKDQEGEKKDQLSNGVADKGHEAEETTGRSESGSVNGQSASLIDPLLNALDTTSLASFFWRSLAANMSSKVGDIMTRGGAPARSLRGAKERLREMIKDAVLKGCEGAKRPEGRPGNEPWEREATVMIASIVSPIGR